MRKTLNVGIDVSRHRYDVCLLDETGEPVGKPFTIHNNRAGASDLVCRLTRIATAYERVQLGMEAIGIYWYHLYRTLARAPELEAHDPRLVVFNPRLI